ncbi:hypothetical protein [Rufibacter latericius]|uniref:Uncharacterized protein n=1 Tax=Rufibacter latericius TaxID=2487040 RepID=A0A3M9MAN8_9BACT|nr:hypothetical protein [Rufibacter latericius]RNI22611.1 hypothetical protein EFB08_21180 [Rufibacter latericius]
MDLLDMLKTHYLRDGMKIYNPSNPKKGLCAYCDKPITQYGRSVTTCEYHWLKKKYRGIKERIKNNEKYPYLIDIQLKMTWEELVLWANENQEYKSMKDPALSRKNMGADYYPDNLQWLEYKDAVRYKPY